MYYHKVVRLSIFLSATREQVFGDGCGANSFMLNDGVCDELTNIAMCLFDGGDCCLQEKSTHLCRACDCTLNIDKDDLLQTFKRLDVRQFDNPEDYSLVATTIVKRVADVTSLDVCSTHRLELEEDKPVNAWMYSNASRVCECTLIESRAFCLEDLRKTIAFSKVSVIPDNSDLAFLQTEKILKCGRHDSNLSYLLPIVV